MILFGVSALLVGQASREGPVAQTLHVIDAKGSDIGILVSIPESNPPGSDSYKFFDP